jgi:hypothetical protein
MDEGTLADLNIVNNGTLHLVLHLRGGMPKKGAKKSISKIERMAVLTAKVQYQRTLLADQNHFALLDSFSHPTFIDTTLATMSLDNLRAVEAGVANSTRKELIHKQVITKFVPQIAAMQTAIANLNLGIEALKEGFQYAYAAKYSDDFGFDLEQIEQDLEDCIANRIAADAQQQAQQQAQLQIEAEVVRRLALVGGADDHMMEGCNPPLWYTLFSVFQCFHFSVFT